MGDINCPTVIGYYGGKFEVSKRLVGLIPPHEKYIEVFAGGLSMFFRKKKAKYNIINDLNKDIANLYLVLSEPILYKEFLHRAKWLVVSRLIYDGVVKEIINDYDNFEIPCVARAVAYYYYIRNSFNGQVNTDLSSDSKWFSNTIAELEWSRDKLADVIIENIDYRKLVTKHVKSEKSIFWYFDPPYVIADTEKYYRFNFLKNNHEEMKLSIDSLNSNNHKFMISYDDVPFIRELYSEYNIKTINFRYGSNGENTDELIITNYDTPEQIGLKFLCQK